MDKNLQIELVESLIEVISTTQVVVTQDFDDEYGNIVDWTAAQWKEYSTLASGLNDAVIVLKNLKEKLEE